jgi:hypothetical protein
MKKQKKIKVFLVAMTKHALQLSARKSSPRTRL